MKTKISLNIVEKFLKCLLILSFILMPSLSFGQSAEISGDEYVSYNGSGLWDLELDGWTEITSIEWTLDDQSHPEHGHGIMYYEVFPSTYDPNWYFYSAGWHHLDCTVSDGQTIIYCEPFYFELGN